MAWSNCRSNIWPRRQRYFLVGLEIWHLRLDGVCDSRPAQHCVAVYVLGQVSLMNSIV
jgi:hypothetical protein